MNVCYVGGCGKLGYPMAVWTATKHNVIMADKNTESVEAVNTGTFSSSEPGVDHLAIQHSDRIVATEDVQAATEQADLVFIIVQTPSESSGAFSTEFIETACKDIGKGINRWKIITVCSTVSPGATDGGIRTVLETASGKKAHKDFGLCYNPEFVRQGNILEDFSCPDIVLIGHSSTQERSGLQEYFADLALNEPNFRYMSIPSAEIAKIGLNTAITAKLARANELAWLCQRTPGADARDVLGAISADPRIASAYFSPGPPPGGPCFPRDGRALSAAMKQRSLSPYLTQGENDSRQLQMGLMHYLVAQYACGSARICVMGLAYKAGVALTDESPGKFLAENLRKSGWSVSTYDPAVESDLETLDQCIDQSDTLVITTPWPEFKLLEQMPLKEKTVIDFWGMLDDEQMTCEYVRFGKGR